jgi:hypothetical protein
MVRITDTLEKLAVAFFSTEEIILPLQSAKPLI